MLIEMFPTLLAVHDDLLDPDYLEELKSKCDEIEAAVGKKHVDWFTPVFNTYNSYDLLSDKTFEPLVSKICEHVKEYNAHMGSSKTMFATEGWFNTYYQKDYQEYHVHQNSIYSAVFFVRAPKGSSPLVLQNPNYFYKMFVVNQIEDSKYSHNTWSVPSEQNKLVIFPSHLLHMVPCHQSKEKRISVALNFRCDL